MADILKTFKVCTGLEVNIQKSRIFTGVVEELNQIHATLGFQISQLPVRYLVLPLLSRSLSHHDCVPIVNRVLTRIKSWKGRFLSYAGRLQLVHSLLSYKQVYWFACYILPKRTIQEIQRIFRKFLLGGPDMDRNSNLVAWNDVCAPFAEGG